jgi:hypothetical protein
LLDVEKGKKIDSVLQEVLIAVGDQLLVVGRYLQIEIARLISN